MLHFQLHGLNLWYYFMYSRMTRDQLETMGQEGTCAIHWAASHGHTSILRYYILERGVNINLQEKGNMRSPLTTPLMEAIYSSKLDTVSSILSHPDCNSNIPDCNQQFALHHAVERGQSPEAEVILKLLVSHLKANGVTNHGQAYFSPLQQACFFGQLWAVKTLLGQKGIHWGQEEEGEILSGNLI